VSSKRPGTAEHLDQHIQLREEGLAADAALSEQAADDLTDGDRLTPEPPRRA